MPRIHVLKTWSEYFNAVLSGAKNFEGRQNDRNYQVGDTLILREWDPKTEEYTGRELQRIITYKLDGGQFGIQQKWCVLSIADWVGEIVKDSPVVVLTRLCEITHAVETQPFTSVRGAMDFCLACFKIPFTDWEAYLIRTDVNSRMKYNDTPVSYCGWKCRVDETKQLLIHSFQESDKHDSCGPDVAGNVTP